MSSEDIFINGELLRLRRESRGWVLNDMATRACMSVKQIRQIEEGGLSSFYSMAVKITAAKKVGALLGLTDSDVLTKDNDPTPRESDKFSEVSTDITPEGSSHFHEVSVSETSQTPAALAEASSIVSVSTIEAEASKPKTSLWIVAVLFATALAVAAYMQPQEELVSEPAPPLQPVPTEASDPASASSSLDVAVTATEAMVTLSLTSASATIAASSPVSKAP